MMNMPAFKCPGEISLRMRILTILSLVAVVPCLAIGSSLDGTPGVLDKSNASSKDTVRERLSGSPAVYPADANMHEEAVDIPPYDVNNSTHVLITESNGNWNNSVLNNLTRV